LRGSPAARPARLSSLQALGKSMQRPDIVRMLRAALNFPSQTQIITIDFLGLVTPLGSGHLPGTGRPDSCPQREAQRPRSERFLGGSPSLARSRQLRFLASLMVNRRA
jgi:hypothetical protein